MTKYTMDQILLQDIIARNIGSFLLELRMSQGLTQKQVAVETNAHQSKVSALEIGGRQPTLSSLVDHIMAIGAARIRKEICDDECPCKRSLQNHTAEECQDGTRCLPGQVEVGSEVLRPGDGDPG